MLAFCDARSRVNHGDPICIHQNVVQTLSPQNNAFDSSDQKLILPGVCPGVWSTCSPPIISPSMTDFTSSTGGGCSKPNFLPVFNIPRHIQKPGRSAIQPVPCK